MSGKSIKAVKLAIVGAAFFAAFVPLSPAFVERVYATSFYPRLQQIMTPASNLTSMPLIELLIPAIILAWSVALFTGVRRHGWKPVVVPVLMRTLVWASAWYLGFVVLWGLNYRRLKLHDKLAFDSAGISRESALRLANIAVDQLNTTHDPAHASEAPPGSVLESALVQGFERAQSDLHSRAIAARPKSTVLEPFFHLTGVAGMTDPYFLEILVDSSLLSFQRPFVIAHEWGHLAGYADESEASFSGFLTCLRGSPADQYSGWLFAYEEMQPILARQDRVELARRLSPGVLDDLRAERAQEQRQMSPRIAYLSELIYDRYLKANRIPSGIANYDETARLLLGVQFADDWTPRFARRTSEP